MSTAWLFCPPPEKVRPTVPAKMSCSLPGAVTRQSRYVAPNHHKPLEATSNIMATGVEVLSQQATAPSYYRMYSRRHSLPCHPRGYHIRRLPGWLCPRMGLTDQYFHPNHHRSGGRRPPIFVSSCCISGYIECGHLVALHPRIRPLRLFRQWTSQGNSSFARCHHVLTLLQRYSDTFDCTASWKAHSGIVLSCIITRGADPVGFELLTGGNDGAINVWLQHISSTSDCYLPFMSRSGKSIPPPSTPLMRRFLMQKVTVLVMVSYCPFVSESHVER
jgi:hypothetical protein